MVCTRKGLATLPFKEKWTISLLSWYQYRHASAHFLFCFRRLNLTSPISKEVLREVRHLFKLLIQLNFKRNQMYTEFSHYFLFLTIFTIISFISLQKYYVALRALKRSHRIIYWMISFYFLIFTSCFYFTLMSYACSDFSFYSILTNCSLQSPLFYKISATWSNHEGSLLLWCWLLSFCGFIFCIRTRSAKQENRISKRQIIRTEQYVNDISQAGAKRYIEEQRQIIVRSTIILTIIIFFLQLF